MKDFVEELRKFITLLLQEVNFALARFADGEGCIIFNVSESEGGWLRRERLSATWHHVPADPVHELFRSRLVDALQYSSAGYHIGLPCRSDHAPQYGHFFSQLKALTQVPESQLTFARVFHSYNYVAFHQDFLPAAFKRKVFLICNERADSSALPGVVRRWNVAAVNASLHSFSVIEDIECHIKRHRVKNGVFLLSIGPGAAVFVHHLWRAHPENTYVDIGSALDPVFFRTSPCRGLSRIYLEKHSKGEEPAPPFAWG